MGGKVVLAAVATAVIVFVVAAAVETTGVVTACVVILPVVTSVDTSGVTKMLNIKNNYAICLGINARLTGEIKIVFSLWKTLYRSRNTVGIKKKQYRFHHKLIKFYFLQEQFIILEEN